MTKTTKTYLDRATKVGFGLINYLSDATGGVETRYHSMAKAMSRLGCDVEAFCQSVGSNSKKHATSYGGVKITRCIAADSQKPEHLIDNYTKLLKGRSDLDLFIASHPAIAIAYQSLFPDKPIIFSPGYFRPLGQIARCRRFVVNFHKHGYQIALRILRTDKLTERCIRSCTATAIPSRMELDWITRYRPEDWPKLRILPRGVDNKRWSLGRSINRNKGGNMRILVASRLEACKDLDHVIKAVADARHANINLTICGTGEQEGHLRSLVNSLGLDNKVEFLGRRDDMPKVYAQADAFILSSKLESFANTALEAMSSGCVLILRRPNPPKSILGNFESLAQSGSVLTYDSNAINELPSLLKELSVNHELLQAYSSKSRMFAREQDWSKIVNQYLSIKDSIPSHKQKP